MQEGKIMDNDIFRKKTIDKMTSPEHMDDFIQVARPKAWLVLFALIFLIMGCAVWACFGVIEVKNENGETERVKPIEFIVN